MMIFKNNFYNKKISIKKQMILIWQNLNHNFFFQRFNSNSSWYDFDHNFINNINWLKSYLIVLIKIKFISI
jgi:hypothetical protein